MRVTDWMTQQPLRITSDASVTAALALLAMGDVRHLPVVDEHEHVTGILSERDVIGLLAPSVANLAEEFEKATQLQVAEFMNTDVIVLEPEDELSVAIGLFLEHKVGAFPVVKNKKLVGILSYLDVLRAFSEQSSALPSHTTD